MAGGQRAQAVAELRIDGLLWPVSFCGNGAFVARELAPAGVRSAPKNLRQLAEAASDKITAGDVGIPDISETVLLTNILNTVYFIAGIISVIVIIVGGFMYITSGGDSGAVGKAKNMILYSVIGLVVVVGAFAITNFVLGAF